MKDKSDVQKQTGVSVHHFPTSDKQYKASAINDKDKIADNAFSFMFSAPLTLLLPMKNR
ncbi:hypothetical protein [Pedobacter jejuensis]|uniref:hypothetical protein n=1 Tax=Pedobacter jejuensis TaxID=1268550 RepID=UPI00142DE38D|nr:hypothetical protein [Pedobacter jejuensis]